MKVAGSVAIVTGGNRGIGEAFVRCLLEAGAETLVASPTELMELLLEEHSHL